MTLLDAEWGRRGPSRFDPPRGQRGVVLLMALVALLLIAAVGAAILFMSATESSLVGNQRQTTQAFFAAQAGLEEAEFRVIAAYTSPTPTLLFGSAAAFPTAVGQVIYIVNPAFPGEVAPVTPGNAYYDTQYQDEFGAAPPAGAALVPSNQPLVGGMPVIPYKWVRITIKTENAARNDINLNGSLDPVTPIYHDGRWEFVGPPAPPVVGQIVYRLTSLAVLPIGTQAMLQREIGGQALPALVVDGSFFISGNPSIQGAAGAAHANGTLTLGGSVCADEYFSSSDTIAVSGTASGSPCSPGGGPPGGPPDLRPGEQPLVVPVLNPASYRPTPGDVRCLPPNPACYIFAANGDVTRIDAAGPAVLGNGVVDPNFFPGWQYTDPGPVNRRWQTQGDDAPTGNYYFESNVTVGSTPGSGSPPQCAARPCPLPITLIVEGSLNVSGNPSFIPTGSFKMGTQPITILAGHDLQISGNPVPGVSGYQGLYYAGDQLRVSGNPDINGQLLVANLSDVDYPPGSGWNPVLITDMGISGNPTITYDGGGGAQGPRAIAWHELRQIP